MWPFHRKPPTEFKPSLRPVTETWRVGDLAECISDVWSVYGDERYPRRGSRHFVTKVVIGGLPGLEGVFLELLGFPARDAWYAAAFRNIVAPGVGADDAADERLPREELVDG